MLKRECRNFKNESAKINSLSLPPPKSVVSSITMWQNTMDQASSRNNPPLALGFRRFGKKSFWRYTFGARNQRQCHGDKLMFLRSAGLKDCFLRKTSVQDLCGNLFFCHCLMQRFPTTGTRPGTGTHPGTGT